MVYTYTMQEGFCEVRYPDGKTIYWNPGRSIVMNGIESESGGGFAIGSDLGDELDFTAMDLGQILEEEYEKEFFYHGPNWVLVIVFFAFGILNVLFPKGIWYLTRGRSLRKYQEDPTELDLTVSRVMGGILIVVAVILIFIR